MSEDRINRSSSPEKNESEQDLLARRKDYVATITDFSYELDLFTPLNGAFIFSGQDLACAGSITNTSGVDWKIVVDGVNSLQMAAEIHSVAAGTKTGTARCLLEGETIRAGETCTFSFQAPTNGCDPGEYRLSFDLIYELVCWFSRESGVSRRSIEFTVAMAVAGEIYPKSLRKAQETTLQIAIEQEIRVIQDAARTVEKHALIVSGFKAYSQCDEDGIIQEIFRRIGLTSQICCEIGCGNGLENNTHYLVLQGWKGVWIDGATKNVAGIRKHLPCCSGPGLSVQEAFITRENINETVGKGLQEILGRSPGEPEPIDFLSLDIDGNDLHVLERLNVVDPRVICVEYNAKFPPPAVITIPYDEKHVWALDDYQGASLQAFVNLLVPRGYRLVTCNASGANAFFVRETELRDIELQPVDRLYQPPRFHLIEWKRGHPPSYRHLAERLRSL